MLDGSMGRGKREAGLGFIWVVCYMRIFCVGPHEVRHTRPTTTRMLRRVVVVARLALQEAKSAVFFWANLEQFSMRPSLWRFLKSKGGRGIGGLWETLLAAFFVAVSKIYKQRRRQRSWRRAI